MHNSMLLGLTSFGTACWISKPLKSGEPLRRVGRVTTRMPSIREEDASRTRSEEGALVVSGAGVEQVEQVEQVVVVTTAGVKTVFGAARQIIGVVNVLKRTVCVHGAELWVI